MRKVLIVITTAFVPYGGLTTVAMNYYRNMDRSGLEIDFASTNKPPKELIHELHADGSEYYCLGERNKKPLEYCNALKQLLKKKKYDIIHVHANSATAVLELLPAKKCGVKKRIIHIHNSTCSHMFLHKLLKPLFSRAYTDALACSKEAGEWIFGEKFIVLNNAIDTEKYQFKEENREKIRNEYGIGKKTLALGHVGKMNEQKNHDFLLDCFHEVRKKEPDAVLLLVGDGPLRGKIEEKVKRLGLEESVCFTGMKNNASEYLSAMDCFVFPSLFEGLGLALIEAQANGLYCIASDVVPIEAKVSGTVEYMSLDMLPAAWAEKIILQKFNDHKENSRKACEAIRAKGYDIKTETHKLKKMYRIE